MHMPPHPGDHAILRGQEPGHQPLLEDPIAAATRLWQALRPERWPLAPASLPPGTALVGGAVRDGLLGRLGDTPDLDLVVEGDAIALCRTLQQRHGGACVVLDAERSMARLVLQGWSLDLARMEPGGLHQDLARRDYTINAMALPLDSGQPLVDPHGALAHLASGSLVAISEANLLDDPLRLLRGVRLASELEMRLEADTAALIQRHGHQLTSVAPERVLAQLWKLATTPSGDHGLTQALTMGLLDPWLALDATHPPAELLALLKPQRARDLGMTAAEQERALPLARLSALLRPDALERLRSSRSLQQRCARLRPWQQRLSLARDTNVDRSPATDADDPEQLNERERLLLHRTLEQDLPALLLQAPAPLARRWLERWRDANDPLFHPRPPLNGADLQQALNLKPSPRLGALLDHLTHEQAFGRIRSREDALEQAQRWISTAAQGC